MTSLMSWPAGSMKSTLEITSTSDFVHVLNSLRFWAVSTPPAEIFDYVAANGHDEQIIPYEADFQTSLPFFALSKVMSRTM